MNPAQPHRQSNFTVLRFQHHFRTCRNEAFDTSAANSPTWLSTVEEACLGRGVALQPAIHSTPFVYHSANEDANTNLDKSGGLTKLGEKKDGGVTV